VVSRHVAGENRTLAGVSNRSKPGNAKAFSRPIASDMTSLQGDKGMKKLRVLILMSAALWLAGVASAQEFPVETRVLHNGMKVIVQPDHSIPNVALYMFYRIGSRNECPGTTGISHFFEHMMFNGARKYGPGELDRAMEANGASNNAFTERDVTVYQDWFPRSALELIFDIEADRIQNLSFSPEKIESERQVVASERRMRVDADNFGLLDEQLWATAFVAHPYQWPVLGWTSDIEHWTIDDLKRQFAMGYSPSNATLVVAGDVTPEEIFTLARKYLEPIPAHAPPPPVTTVEPDQMGERRLVVHKLAELPILMIGYHVPQTNSKDYYALEVLRTILSWGESSRLYRRLVDKDQTALDVEVDVGPALDPTLLVITARPKQDADPQKVENAIYEEIARIQGGGVSDAELEKAKNVGLVRFYHEVQTINARANTIGTYEIFFGDYRKLFEAAKNYAAVTKEDVQRAARAYLGERNRTVATLLPEGQEKGKP
jgi:zinc protease